MPVVRMADLEIDPAQLDGFKAAVKEEMEISVRVEPGVLAIYAVAEKDNPAKLRFSRCMPVDEAASTAHIGLAALPKVPRNDQGYGHVRKLIEMVPVQLSDKKK